LPIAVKEIPMNR